MWRASTATGAPSGQHLPDQCCPLWIKEGYYPEGLAFRTSGRPFVPHLDGERSGVGVAGGGHAEEVEDLLLERVEVGLEGLDVLAIAA